MKYLQQYKLINFNNLFLTCPDLLSKSAKIIKVSNYSKCIIATTKSCFMAYGKNSEVGILTHMLRLFILHPFFNRHC